MAENEAALRRVSDVFNRIGGKVRLCWCTFNSSTVFIVSFKENEWQLLCDVFESFKLFVPFSESFNSIFRERNFYVRSRNIRSGCFAVQQYMMDAWCVEWKCTSECRLNCFSPRAKTCFKIG